MVKKCGLILAAAAAAAAVSGTGAFAQTQWSIAVAENEENTVLNYTVYDSRDSADVEAIASCPNDDASEYNIKGVMYQGVNYGGSPTGGIRTNITAYIEPGDKLRISFDYRSPSYEENSAYDVTPVIEVKGPDGVVSQRYEFAAAPQSDVWTSYTSAESEPVEFSEGDSVSLALMNERGFWHMKGLVIERYGETPFISGLEIGGAAEGGVLRDGAVTVSGTADGPCTLYTAFYNNGRLLSVDSRSADGSFELSAQSSGADEMKLLAWDGMEPKTEEITVRADGNGSYKPEEAVSSLKEKYSGSFLIGNIYNNYNINDAKTALILEHFNVLTGENNMKPEVTAPSKNYYNFSQADAMTDFAEENGLDVIGHTFIWHKQSAAWLTEGTADEVWDNMESFIGNVAGHFKGRVKGWDVVNEAIRDNIDQVPPSWSYYIRKDSEATGTPWFRARRDSEYIYRAFVMAHEADPDAELYYNDYNLDMPYKREAAALLVKHINDKYKQEYKTDENLVDAIGMQSHYSLETNVDDVRASIDRFREIGVKVNITELDVCINRVGDNGEGDSGAATELSASDEMKQAVKYAELMTVYKENADIIDRVTFWGLNDGDSWRSPQHPTLFDAQLKPKKAFYAVMEPENYR